MRERRDRLRKCDVNANEGMDEKDASSQGRETVLLDALLRRHLQQKSYGLDEVKKDVDSIIFAVSKFHVLKLSATCTSTPVSFQVLVTIFFALFFEQLEPLKYVYRERLIFVFVQFASKVSKDHCEYLLRNFLHAAKIIIEKHKQCMLQGEANPVCTDIFWAYHGSI